MILAYSYKILSLSLDDSSFEILDFEPFEGMEVNEQIYDKTIAHLLAHRGGWGRDVTGDPSCTSYTGIKIHIRFIPHSTTDIVIAAWS